MNYARYAQNVSRTLARRLAVSGFCAAVGLALCGAATTCAQDAPPPVTPSEALANILATACRANDSQFSTLLTGDNVAAFRALSPEMRVKVMRRISLTDETAKPLLTTGKDGLPSVRCQGPAGSVEFRLGVPRVHENLAFIPVSVQDATDADFGLIREAGGWHLLSIGLVIFDIPQLQKQWAAADAAVHDEAAIKNLRDLAEAIQRYQRVFGAMPETLAVLGPAPPNQISAEQASLVDAQMAAGAKDGYAFRYRIVPDAAGNDTSFELAATPQKYPSSGKRSFFLDKSGKVHGADNQGVVATIEDPLIDGEKAE
jgi:hypothetical protein